jgi:hypothetical protein
MCFSDSTAYNNAEKFLYENFMRLENSPKKETVLALQQLPGA